VKDVGNTASRALRGILKAQLEAFVRYAEKKKQRENFEKYAGNTVQGFCQEC
jgi:hypothetical protein